MKYSIFILALIFSLLFHLAISEFIPSNVYSSVKVIPALKVSLVIPSAYSPVGLTKHHSKVESSAKKSGNLIAARQIVARKNITATSQKLVAVSTASSGNIDVKNTEALIGAGLDYQSNARSKHGNAKSNITIDTPPTIQVAGRYYPEESRELGEEGVVQLKILVAKNGTAREIKVIKSSNFSRLDKSARRAAFHWVFNPARKDGEAVDAILLTSVKFYLDK